MTENSAQNQRWSWATCGAVLVGLILYMSSGRNVAQKGPIPAANSTVKSNSVAPNEVAQAKLMKRCGHFARVSSLPTKNSL